MTSTTSSLFLDIGGVLLTNGWDRNARCRAAEVFNLDTGKMNERHHLTFDNYEGGKLNLDEYLDPVVFCETRPFSRDEFRELVQEQSLPFPGMIGFIYRPKSHHRSIDTTYRELVEWGLVLPA